MSNIHMDLRMVEDWIIGQELCAIHLRENLVSLEFERETVIQAYARLEIGCKLAWSTGKVHMGFLPLSEIIGDSVHSVEIDESRELAIFFSSRKCIRFINETPGYEWIHIIRPGEEIVGI